jgi:hypothetical protein
MSLEASIVQIGQLIDAYAARTHEFCRMADVECVPPEMIERPVDRDGMVTWKLLPSSLRESDLSAFESAIGATFPPSFRTYLLARFHLYEQVQSNKHRRGMIWAAIPSNAPFRNLARMISAWPSLIAAGYVPIAEWGDGWGPVCFDIIGGDSNGECPVVWMEHEHLFELGAERCRSRSLVAPLAQPLYESSRELIPDLFTLP